MTKEIKSYRAEMYKLLQEKKYDEMHAYKEKYSEEYKAYKEEDKKLVYFFYEYEKTIFAIEEGKKELLKFTIEEKTNMNDCFFEMAGGYESSLDGLLDYRKEFYRCCNELKSIPKMT